MGKTIALIDDSSVMRAILRKAILMSKFEVDHFVEAENGLEGLEVIRSNKEKLDLIITDLHMPKCGGVEMLEELKTSAITRAPIVVISTVGDSGMQKTCKNLGAVAFLEKPFSHEDIETLLESVFQDAKTAANGVPAGEKVS